MSIIVYKTLRINAIFLFEILFPLSLTFAQCPEVGKMSITMSVKDQTYDMLDYFDVVRKTVWCWAVVNMVI